ncbi:hypothetical protein [Lysinibacillus xylanilyticus]|uniref:Uncharacterized protein n=1 Tax=Lysinibacillus xylanilyticus TaxID=582475 RepID=A0ABV3W012_9BACI
MTYIKTSKVSGISKEVSDFKMIEDLASFWNLSKEEMIDTLESGEKLWTPYAIYEKQKGE